MKRGTMSECTKSKRSYLFFLNSRRVHSSSLFMGLSAGADVARGGLTS